MEMFGWLITAWNGTLAAIFFLHDFLNPNGNIAGFRWFNRFRNLIFFSLYFFSALFQHFTQKRIHVNAFCS